MNGSSREANAKLNIISTLTDLSSAGLPEGEPEKSESFTDGKIKFSPSGDIFISYKEDTEGGAVFSDIKISESKVTVLRRGAIESTMVFEEGILHRSLYSMPPYRMDMEIMTKRIRRTLSDGVLSLNLIYEMKIGGSARSAVFKINAEF